ncbi:hypothetical protein B0T21DRAFT_33049 [Apiosordaria backusii]|uniref:Secreted protein n=1 Tax=Apiosordaria backusii TaxID=314023 RepID=A0AA40B2H8_9PEZI|nr:hypothetical protein B0T21DRAFT_33049 [Apiosordaria backusii]
MFIHVVITFVILISPDHTFTLNACRQPTHINLLLNSWGSPRRTSSTPEPTSLSYMYTAALYVCVYAPDTSTPDIIPFSDYISRNFRYTKWKNRSKRK